MPRLCLGKDMATLEAKLLMASLLRRYRFALAPRSAGDLAQQFTFGVTLSLGPGLWVTCSRR